MTSLPSASPLTDELRRIAKLLRLEADTAEPGRPDQGRRLRSIAEAVTKMVDRLNAKDMP